MIHWHRFPAWSRAHAIDDQRPNHTLCGREIHTQPRGKIQLPHPGHIPCGQCNTRRTIRNNS